MGILSNLFAFGSTQMAMDLGTANTLIYLKDHGIVLDEPSVVAVESQTGKLIAVGKEAKAFIGRTPPNISAVRPLKDGVIADFDIAKAMIKHFLNTVREHYRVSKPKMVVGVPSGITQVEKKAVFDACFQVGIREVYLIEEPMAAAIGVGLPIDLPKGNMVVDVGGGTTEVAIISLSAIAYSESLKVAGDEMDEAIQRYIQRKHQIAIGIIAAENLKITAASLEDDLPQQEVAVTGKDLLTGVPKRVTVTRRELKEALEEPVSAIVDAIRRTLERLPAEFVSDLSEEGMTLTGGGALLKGLDRRIETEVGIKVKRAEDPLLSVVLGSGKTLEDMKRFRRVFIS